MWGRVTIMGRVVGWVVFGARCSSIKRMPRALFCKAFWYSSFRAVGVCTRVVCMPTRRRPVARW